MNAAGFLDWFWSPRAGVLIGLLIGPRSLVDHVLMKSASLYMESFNLLFVRQIRKENTTFSA